MTKVNFKQGAKMERWEKALQNPQKALKQIGVLMVAESQASFRDQQFGRKKWKGRAPVNVFGIIADFSKGSTPPKRRFQTRKALIDTGRLKGSISYKVSGSVVEVGTNLDYAGVHQFGGQVESEKITKSVQQALSKWLKPKDKGLKESLGWILNKKFTGETIKGQVPARQFVGITKQTRQDIAYEVGVLIMETS
tara:strand:- start:766 stop:1347 length:582 start_codon:yes stop_codon:yes gene_type:complete